MDRLNLRSKAPFLDPTDANRGRLSPDGREALIREHTAALQSGSAWAKETAPPEEDSYFWKFFPMIANYNPADYWRRVTVPVLIVEAGKDERVPVDSSTAAIQQALKEGRNSD